MDANDDPLLRLDASIIKLLDLRQKAMASKSPGSVMAGCPGARYLDERRQAAAEEGLDVEVVDHLFGKLPHPAPPPPPAVLTPLPMKEGCPGVALVLTLRYPVDGPIDPDVEKPQIQTCPTCMGSTYVQTEDGQEKQCPTCGPIGRVVPDPTKKTEPKVRPAMFIAGPPRPGAVHDWTCGGKLKRRSKNGPRTDAQGRVWDQVAYAPVWPGTEEHRKFISGIETLLELGRKNPSPKKP